MTEKRKLVMHIELSVLEHLGMNLYSNTPAVISEVVANAWDADAKSVKVNYDQAHGSITVLDDGTGMTREEVIDRFLSVGFRRREHMAGRTPKHNRLPMGRKGIGKLSCFSIAEVVTVYTQRMGERTAFQLDVNDIREQFRRDKNGDYEPTELKDRWPDDLTSDGTCVVLTELKKNITALSHKALKQRVARRFSVLGSQFDFQVHINNEEVGPGDRGYLDKVQYLWTYGNQEKLIPEFTSLAEDVEPEERTENMEDSLSSASINISVSGWIGTVETPNQLIGEDGQNLNQLGVFMRGKMAQEDLLGELAEKRIIAGYLVGEIHCEILDVDDQDDIATTSRQAIKADEERYSALRNAIRSEVRYIAPKWNELRTEGGAKTIAGEVPEVMEWLDSLQNDTRTKATRWIGRLNVIQVNTDRDRRELLKSSVLAFETYRRKEMLDHLKEISDEGIEDVLQLFTDIDDLQLSYYGQIVKMRLSVVEALIKKLDDDEYERVLQKHIYDHLWLIDPSWERVIGTDVIESKLKNFLDGDTKELNDDEKDARIDIGYRSTAGRHVIIEMKRGSVAVQIDDLTKQIRKYRDGAKRILQTADENEWPLEIVCLVGKPPREWNGLDGKEQVLRSLQAVDARLVFYDQLLHNTQRAYRDYLRTNEEIDKLAKIFNAIDDFDAAESTSDTSA